MHALGFQLDRAVHALAAGGQDLACPNHRLYIKQGPYCDWEQGRFMSKTSAAIPFGVVRESYEIHVCSTPARGQHSRSVGGAFGGQYSIPAGTLASSV